MSSNNYPTGSVPTAIEQLRRSEFIVVRADGGTSQHHVARVVAPKHLQVGLEHPEFRSTFKVIGSSTFERGAIIHQGITGSLQKLYDGTDYLRAGTNLSVTNNLDGSITIGTSAGSYSGNTTNALTAGTGISLNSGTTFNGSAAKTMSLNLAAASGLSAASGLTVDINSLSSATPADADLLMIRDDGDGALKKITVSSLSSAAQAGVSLQRPLTPGDGLVFETGNASYNNAVAETIKINLAANSGLAITSDAIHVSPSVATSKGTPHADDVVLIGDSQDSNNLKKATIASLGTAASTLSNILSVGDGLKLQSGAASYNNSVTQEIKVKTNGATISSAGAGIAVVSTPGTLSNGAGIAAFTFNGSSNVQIAVDTSSLVTYAADGTFTGDITFSGDVFGNFKINSSTPLVTAGTNVTITTAGNGQMTINAAAAAIDIDSYNQQTPARSDIMVLESGGSNIKSDVASIADLVDRTSLATTSDTVQITTNGAANAFSAAVKLNGATIASNAQGLSVASLPNSVTAGTGIAAFTFNGSSAATVAIDEAVVPRLNGSTFTGVVNFNAGLSGSIYNLTDGKAYITGGTGILVTTGSTGQVVITNTDAGGAGSMDISGLGVDSNAGNLADFMAIADSSDGNETKKITLDQLKTLVGGGAAETFKTIAVSGQSNVVADSGTDTLTLAGGANVTITTNASTDTVTIAAAASGDSFKTISVSGQSDVVADSVTDTLTLVGGANVAITTNAGTDTVTIAATDTNTTYTAGGGLDLTGTAFSTDLNDLSAAVVDVANDSVAIIDANDSNTSRKEAIADVVSAIAGDGIKAAAGVLAVEPNDFAGVGLQDDGSDNLRLNVDGLAADGNAGALADSIAIADASDSNLTKKITLTQLKARVNTDTNTTYTAGDGLGLSGTEFSVDLKSSGGLVIDSAELSIDYAGNDSVIKSATDGTGITVDAANDLLMIYDNDATAVKYINPNQLPGGTIGAAEDGSYSDGLFTDFTTSTPVGTPVDRFNEILKLLVPAPAPDLDDVDVNSDGTDAKLSFGTSNNQSAASPPYVNVANSAGIAAAVDVNGDYVTAESSNNLRAAVYNGSADLIGDLNEDIAANVTTPSSETNYVANSFGDANVGSLVLELNGVDIYTLSLTAGGTGAGVPGSGTGTHVNGAGDYTGSGFINVSALKSGTFDNGTSFDNFKHRTGRWKVAATGDVGQKNGWNYARVKHVKTGVTVVTNYVEWVNDPDSNALSTASNSLAFTGTGSLQISGVTYFTGGNAQYQVTVSNAYRYVYDTTATSFTTSNAGTRSGVTYNIGNVAKASIGGGEDHLKQIVINETDSVTANYILGGSITAGVTVSHPIKTNLTNAGQSSETGILLYNVSDTATVTSETFQREAYRLQLDAYANQSDVTGGSLNWNPATSLVGGGTHGDGLQVYRERLYAPKNTLNSGDFRNTSDGGSLANGPDSNPNYSAATGLRTYYRKFKNAGAAKRDLSYTIAGSVTLVANGDTVGANNKFRLYFKMPSDGAGNTTGWLDAKTAFSYNTVSDNAGCAIGAVDTSNAMTNNITFGTVEVGTNEWVVAKIVTDDDWSGYLDSLAVTFGAVNAVNASPNVNDIDCNQSGVNGKLSFGATLTKGGYTAVSTAAGFSAVNANGAYNLSSDRRAIFDGTQVISGDINESTAASGNSYPANAFGGGSAHQGTLKLEVNGSVIHTADLTSFGSGSSLTSASGFINLSAATVGNDASSLPDYTKFYRTGQFQVAVAAQRNGWNYARVIHRFDSSDHASDYVEWVNDDSDPTISFSGVAVGNFTSGSTYQCSGVTYFISPTGRFDFTVANLYKYVYSSSASAISFPTTTNSTVTSIAATGDGVTNSTVSAASRTLPVLDTSVSDAYDDNLVVQAAFSFDQGTSIPGETAYSVTLTGRVHHPLEGNTTTSSTSSAELLVANFTDNSTNTTEYFNGEAKRLKAGTTAYTTQAHVSGGSNNWNSATSMDGADAAHNTGLIVYDGKLRSPQKVGPSGNLGDFRDSGQSGTIIAPNGNPDYGSLTNATREYIRWFRNTSGASKTNFDLTINGTGTIVQNTEALGSSNKIQVFAKISHSSADQTTGWMDTAKAFASGQNGDNAGALVGSLDSSLNATNEVTFGTKFVDNNEYILVKIVADKTWTGNVTQMSVSWS